MLKKSLFVLAVAVLAMFGLGARCSSEVEESRANPNEKVASVR
jgi:hypothetical protein